MSGPHLNGDGTQTTLRDIIGQELKGDEIVQLDVLGFLDHTHPAAAPELLNDAVMRDGLTDHWAEILGPDVWQVNESWGVGSCSRGLLLKHPDYAQNPGQ